jgi:hypothetical protein
MRFGNRLAEGITIGCSSLSAMVSAEEQISDFCIFFHLLFLKEQIFCENAKVKYFA